MSTRGKIMCLGPSLDLARAECSLRAAEGLREASASKVKYHLEYPNGGKDPTGYFYDEDTLQADCIGYAVWCRGFDRFNGAFPLYDGYINTDSMLDEAMNVDQRIRNPVWFNVLDYPKIGCFIVGRSFFSKLRMRNVTGHIGVVTDIHPGVLDAKGRVDLSKIEVAHCSPFCYKFTGGASAVWKTDATIWGGYPTLKFIDFVHPGQFLSGGVK